MQLSTKFILLINVKMPTIVGIVTFISMINTPSERPKVRHFFICQNLDFKAVVLLLLNFCLSLLPFWESVIVLCFVVRYFMSS